MLFRIITLLFIIGILVRLFSRYIYPIVKVTSAASSRLRQMQDQINEMHRQEQQRTQTNDKPIVPKKGDYIDYEEVR